MPAPIGVKLAIKAAVAVATDKKARKIVGAIILAALSPFILAIALICAILGGGSSHNNAAVHFAFKGGDIPAEAPEEYRQYLEDMRACFDRLDELIEEKNEELDEGSLNPERVKALFFALHFGEETLDFDDEYYADFVNCFVGAEECGDDPDISVLFSLDNMDEVYGNITDFLGRTMTEYEKSNAENIYNSYRYGDNIPDDTYSFYGYWESGLEESDIQY
jgi:hypothetical protein